MKLLIKACFIFIIFSLLYTLLFKSSASDHETARQLRNFEAFNNETGSKSMIIPNIIHFIQFDQKTISFIHFICICSAFYNHGPTSIFLHTNVLLKGKYFLLLKKQLGTVLVIHQVQKPSHVFGQVILAYDWSIQHLMLFSDWSEVVLGPARG